MSLSNSNSSTPLPATVSLSSLPTEIKSQIVNYVKLQDESCKGRAESDNLHESELLEGVLKENEWRGKSLNALFLVDMEWSNLAAIHLFSALEVYDIDSFIAENIVLPRRGSLVRSVTFYTLNLARKTLLFLRLLPNLSKMILAQPSVKEFFGDLSKLGSTGNFEQDQLYRIFLLAAQSITSVTLTLFTAAEAAAFLSAFPNVKELKFTTAVIRGTEEELEGLGNLLSKLSLKKLFFDDFSDSIPSSWIEQNWGSPLTFVKLKSDEVDYTHFNFLNKFSSTLEVLQFHESDRIPGEVLSKLGSSNVFDKLHSLKVEVSSGTLYATLDLFLASPIVSLTVESNNIVEANDVTTIDTVVGSFVREHSTLRYLEIRFRFIDINKFTALSTLCDSKGIILKLNVWHNQITQDALFPLNCDDKLLYYRPVLEKSLNYGQRKLKELERGENVEGMEEMFENCKWLRANAAEMMD